jgi:hypothetical protein
MGSLSFLPERVNRCRNSGSERGGYDTDFDLLPPGRLRKEWGPAAFSTREKTEIRPVAWRKRCLSPLFPQRAAGVRRRDSSGWQGLQRQLGRRVRQR